MNPGSILVFFIAFYSAAFAEEISSLEKQWEISPSVNKLDLGTLLQGEIREASITLKNSAVSGFQSINKVSQSCNCFDIHISSDSIPLAGTVTIHVKVAARADTNEMREELVIEYINSDERNIRFLRIPIVATVDTVLSFEPPLIRANGDELALQQFTQQVKVLPGIKISEVKSLSLDDSSKLFKLPQSVPLNGKASLSFEARINVENVRYGRNQTSIKAVARNAQGEIVLIESIQCEIFLESPFDIQPASFLVSDLGVGSSKNYEFTIALKDADLQVEDIKIVSSNFNRITIEEILATSKNSIVVTFNYTRLADGAQTDYVEIQLTGNRIGTYRIPVIVLNTH